MSGRGIGLRSLARRLLAPPEDFKRSYSQQGEDMILHSLFQTRATGFYVDVGAHHPVRYSNTYYFYRRGWSGINIDAMPGSMAPFRRFRPRDVNIEAGVAAERGVLPYYRFDEPGVNGFAFDEDRLRELSESFKFRDKIEVETFPLAEILEKHVPRGRQIDFMTIDVEGLDLQVLRSNDWTAYRPAVVVAEDLAAFTLAAVVNSPLSRYLGDLGYEACAKGHHSTIYARRDRLTANNFRDS